MSWTDPDNAIPPGNLEIIHEFPYSSLADPESYEVEGRRMCVRWLSHKQLKEWPEQYSMAIETSNGTVRVVLQNTRPVPVVMEEEDTQPSGLDAWLPGSKIPDVFKLGDKVLWGGEEYTIQGCRDYGYAYELRKYYKHSVAIITDVPAKELTRVD